MIFKGKSFEFVFPRPTLVMGILNVTPDSFSDGGAYFDKEKAVQKALLMESEGAEIIDVGAESTRPGFKDVSLEEEWGRLFPIITELKKQISIPISIDTRHVEVARLALKAGADIINDVGLMRSEEKMFQLIAESGGGYIMMHSSPLSPENRAPQEIVDSFFGETLARCEKLGMHPHQIVLDPGVGFGKTVEQNLLLIRSLNHYTKRKRPVLLGASRKSFIRGFPGGALTPKDRLGGSLAAACFAVSLGVHILRVHDVKETLQAVRLTEWLEGSNELEPNP
ncbi:MAG TPA: dihydropteroate synthase [Verrucomicrobiota bacterium]|jgi:dihydropteroate synthase|nr:dihydropteroate synthase [Verrucomicrobiota bacterium]